MIKKKYRLFCWLGLLVCVAYLTGCSESDPKNHNRPYLIQVGNTGMTPLEFNKAFELEKTFYPHDITQNAEFSDTIRSDFLKQTMEKMILLERARELHLEISDAEINKVIDDLRSDYPDDEFEQALLKSAVSYNAWKNELKNRLLMEKVVAKELGKAIRLSAEDMEKYYDNTDDSDEIKAKSSPSKKAEEVYDIWIKKLQKKYVIRIDQAQWKKICMK